MPAVVRVSAVYTMSDQVSSKLKKMTTKVAALERNMKNTVEAMDSFGKQAKALERPLKNINQQLSDMGKTIGTKKSTSGLQYKVRQLADGLKALSPKDGHLIKLQTTGANASKREIERVESHLKKLTGEKHTIKLDVDKDTANTLRDQAQALNSLKQGLDNVKVGFSNLTSAEDRLRKTMTRKSQAAEQQRATMSQVERQFSRTTKQTEHFRRAAMRTRAEVKTFREFMDDLLRSTQAAGGMFRRGVAMSYPLAKMLPMLAMGAQVAGVALGGLMMMVHGLIGPVLNLMSGLKDMVGVFGVLPGLITAAATAFISFRGAMSAFYGDALSGGKKLSEIRKELERTSDPEERLRLQEQESKLMDKMTFQQQKLAEKVADTFKLWRDLFTSNTDLQNKFFRSAFQALNIVQALMKRYAGQIQVAADWVRLLALRFFQVIRNSQDFHRGMEAVFRVIGSLAKNIRNSMEPLIDFFGRLLLASEGPIKRIGDSFERWAYSLNDISVADIESFLNRALDTMSAWWKVVKDLWVGLGNILGISREFPSGFAEAAESFREWTESAEGIKTIEESFREGMKVAQAFGRVVSSFVLEFMKLGGSGSATRSVVGFLDMLAGGMPTLFKFFDDTLTKLGPSMTRLLDSFGEFIDLVGESSGSLGMVLDVMSALNEVFDTLPDPVKDLVGQLLALKIMAFGAGNVVGGFMGILASGFYTVTNLARGFGSLTSSVRAFGRAGKGASAGARGAASAAGAADDLGRTGGMARGMGGRALGLLSAGGQMAAQKVDVVNSVLMPVPVMIVGGTPGFFKKGGLARGAASSTAAARGVGSGAAVGGKAMGPLRNAKFNYQTTRAFGGSRLAALGSGARGLGAGGAAAAGMSSTGLGAAAGNVGKVAGKVAVPLAIITGSIEGLGKAAQDNQGFISQFGSAGKGFLEGIDITKLLPGDGLSSLLPQTGADIAEVQAQGDAAAAETAAFADLRNRRTQIYDVTQGQVGAEKDFLRQSLGRLDLSKQGNRNSALLLAEQLGMKEEQAKELVVAQAREQQVNRNRELQKKISDGQIKTLEDAQAYAEQLNMMNPEAAGQKAIGEHKAGIRTTGGGRRVNVISDAEKKQQDMRRRRDRSYVAPANTMSESQFEATKTAQKTAEKAEADMKAANARLQSILGETGVMGLTALQTQRTEMEAWYETAAAEMHDVAAAYIQDGIIDGEKYALEDITKIVTPLGEEKIQDHGDALKSKLDTIGGEINTKTGEWIGTFQRQMSEFSAAAPTGTGPSSGGGGSGSGGGVNRGGGVGMAQGGVVPGDPRQGDVVPAILRPGEIVLNKGQQAKLGIRAKAMSSLVGPGTMSRPGGHNLGALGEAPGYAEGGAITDNPFQRIESMFGLSRSSGDSDPPGSHATGSYHFQRAPWGGVRAYDYGDAKNPPGQLAAASRFLQQRPQGIAEQFYDLVPQYIKNGQIVGGSFGGHADHLHLAFAAGASMAGAFGPPPSVPAPPNLGTTRMGRGGQPYVDNAHGIMQQRLKAAFESTLGSGMGTGGGGGEVIEGSPRAIGRAMAAERGWTGAEWNALDNLWQRESNWNPTARNPSSGAYGIPQALPPTKMPHAAQAAGGSDPAAQIGWGLDYIAGRPDYGSPSKAWELWQSRSPHWYGDGGSGFVDKPQVIGVGDKPENVQITPAGTQATPRGITASSGGGGASATITNNFYIGSLSGDRQSLNELAAMVGDVIADNLESAARSRVPGSADVMSGNG